MRPDRGLVAVLAGAVLLTLGACVPTANEVIVPAQLTGESAGFLLGLWHGVTVPFTFVVSLFNDSVGIYEIHNTGWPYNLGFVLGAMSSGGGAATGSRRKRSRT